MKNPIIALVLGLILPLTASDLPIVVNPATPLTGTFAVEWNTATNFESWVTSGVTSATVGGGALSGTTNNGDPQVTRTIPVGSRPDLDLGFNDFLEIRMRVPANYADEVQIYYGTTSTTGFSADRLITIPNATIPKNGAFNTYRIDVGPEPWWRASLRDLRVDPGNAAGVAFAIDYIRVGDEPNPTVYQARFTTKCPAVGGATPPEAVFGPGTAVSSLESKRFRLLWNNSAATQSGWNTNTARGTLRNLEEAWQVLVKVLGYREPCFPVGTTSGTAFKLNVTSYYGGYWAGLDDHGGTSLAQLNITPDGLQVNPPTWIIPHELTHCIQFHNTSGHVNGEWFETHANYARERWLQHYQNVYPNRSNIEALGVRDGHFMMSSGRNYYLTWPFMYYVDTNPDNLPDLSEGMIRRVWQETQPGEFPMMALDRITPTTSLKDLSGYYARRCATWDFSNQTAMNAELNAQDPTRNARHFFTDLIQRPDAPTWWRVPPNKAPAQGAYAMHELIPNGSGAGRVVMVNLQGLADSARGADWRASLIAVSDTGVERYTPLWSNGNSSITLAANENKLFLSVAGTPDVYRYGGHDEATFRFRSHPSRSRFHYQVQVTGATPRVRTNGATSGLTQHSNGGGWKSVTVPNSVFIGPNARVTGGTVSGNARIEDYAVVSGGTVNSNAIISGNAWVRGGTVTGDARVRDWAIVDGGTISGNARVLEHATVEGNLQDTAVAKGSALHQSGGMLSGNAIVDGDYMFNKSLTGGVTFGHLPFVGIPDNFTAATPAGLYAAYDFKSAHDSRALDQYGVTDGFTTGSPVWTFTDGKRKGFLNFNGSNQSITLDRSVADSRAFTFAAWVKPAGGSANQALLWLGATPTRRMSLTADDGSGQTKFSIVNGGAEQTLATTALPVGVWSHVAVTLDGSTGVLYINGSSATSGAITIRPDQLLAENTTTAFRHHYLARSEGGLMPMFQGSLDDAQFFSTALNSSQLAAATVPLLGGIGTVLLSDHFNSESYSVGEFNNTLASDQQGFLATISYNVTSGGQGWQAQHGNGGTMLLVGDVGFGSNASLNEDFSIAANGLDQPISIQFDATVSDTSNGECWSSFAIGSGQNLIASGGGAKFGILPKLNGSMEVWVNGSLQPLANRSGNNYRIILSDTEGDGSAFNGNGSKATLYNGATLVGTYTLPQLAPGDGYLSFGANPFNGSFNITRIDNLSISRVITSYNWQGDAGTGFTTPANWVEDVWEQWDDYDFGSAVTNGSVAINGYFGINSLNLQAGLSQDIVITSSNAQPIIMGIGVAGNSSALISIADASRDLTINGDYIANGTVTWDVGSGRTLALNGPLSNWFQTASLVKNGAGTAILGGAISYTGNTTVGNGTLKVGGQPYFNVGRTTTIAPGAVFELNNSNNTFTSLMPSSTVTGGGTFRLSGNSNINQSENGVTGTRLTFAMQVGGWIDMLDSSRLTNGGWLVMEWSSNRASMNIANAATFDIWDGQPVTIDVLTGSGTFDKVHGGNSPTSLTVGIANGSGTFSGTLKNTGGQLALTKVGSGTQTLSGTTSHTGGTTVNGGTLRLGNGTTATNLSDTGSVIIASGAMLHLDYVGTDTIGGLWVDGLQMPVGIYSATSGFITGLGTLTVTSGPASANYAAWSSRGIHNLTVGPSADDDADGIPHLLEYVLGGNPRATSNNILPIATVSSGNLVFTFRRIHSTTADTIQVFQYGTDLTGWTDVPVVAGGMVAIQANTPLAGTDTVIITVPAGTESRIFGRIKVTIQTPQP
jgi:autotransporter-associated beta strand protein